MVKGSWSQGHDVDQHSRAELQLHTIFSSCVQRTIAGSEALPRSRRGHQTNRGTALSTVSHGPSRYPIVRTSWYRLRSPYASLPATLESVAETWKRLAPSFWVPIASEFFLKTWQNAYLHVHDLGHIGKLQANLYSFKTPLTRLNHTLLLYVMTTIHAYILTRTSVVLRKILTKASAYYSVVQ